MRDSFPGLVIHSFDRAPSPTFMITNQADLIICSYGDNGCNLIEILGVYDQQKRVPKVLVASMRRESMVAPHCLRAGASGFISKYATAEELVAAVGELLSGGCYFCSSEFHEAEVMQESAPKVSGIATKLSRREMEVFIWIAQGLPVRNIAPRLGISVKTVESHRENIKHKLGLKNAVEVAIVARDWGTAKR